MGRIPQYSCQFVGGMVVFPLLKWVLLNQPHSYAPLRCTHTVHCLAWRSCLANFNMNIAVCAVYISDKEFGCLLYHPRKNVCHLKFRVSLIRPAAVICLRTYTVCPKRHEIYFFAALLLVAACSNRLVEVGGGPYLHSAPTVSLLRESEGSG